MKGVRDQSPHLHPPLPTSPNNNSYFANSTCSIEWSFQRRSPWTSVQNWIPHVNYFLKGSQISIRQKKGWFKSKTWIQKYRNAWGSLKTQFHNLLLLSPSFFEQKIVVHRSPLIDCISKSSVKHSEDSFRHWYTWQQPRSVIFTINANTYTQAHQERNLVVFSWQNMYNIISLTCRTRASRTKFGVTGPNFGQSLGMAPSLVTRDHHTLEQAKIWPPWPHSYTRLNIWVTVGSSMTRRD